MKALVIGAGNSGSNLAVKLCQERHDVVLVDKSAAALAAVEARLDVMTVVGHGCNPRVLSEAQLANADLVVAVTGSDDVNILACLQAAQVGVSYKVARVAHPDYMQANLTLSLARAGVDLAINPGRECAREIVNNLKLPGAQEVVELLGGRVVVVALAVTHGSPLLGVSLGQFPYPELLMTNRFIAVLRDGELIVPRGDTRFEQNDEVYVVGRPAEIARFLDWSCPHRPHIERVVIAGSDGVAMHLAKALEHENFQVMLIEPNLIAASEAADQLHRATVIHGRPMTGDTLLEAGLGPSTAYVASMASEEHNIINCLLARKYGAGLTVAQVTDPEYVPIINSLSAVDRAVSTHLSMINAILHFLRGQRVEAVSIMHRLPGELHEALLRAQDLWAHKRICDIKMPKGAVIASVLRQETICPATGELLLLPGDRVVIFAATRALRKLNSIFLK